MAVSHLNFSVPLNTAQVGGHISRALLRLPCDLSFEDFWSRICAKMDLDVQDAKIGYKYQADRVGDAPRILSSDDDLRAAIEHAQGLVRRARTKKVEIMIHNLVRVVALALRCLLTRLQKPAIQALSAKRKANDMEEVSSTSIDLTTHLRQLKDHLGCSKHRGQFCYVCPIDSEHVKLDIFTLTLWAKKIVSRLGATHKHIINYQPNKVTNEASLKSPPNILTFDHRATKKLRHANKKDEAVIHVHNHIGSGPPLTALSHGGGQHHANTPSSAPPTLDLTQDSDSDDDFLVIYPSIHDALQELHEVMPLSNMLTYESGLVRYGVDYVVNTKDLDPSFLRDEVGMPIGVISPFKDHIHRLVKRARKGKGRELVGKRKVVKCEGDDENCPINVD